MDEAEYQHRIDPANWDYRIPAQREAAFTLIRQRIAAEPSQLRHHRQLAALLERLAWNIDHYDIETSLTLFAEAVAVRQHIAQANPDDQRDQQAWASALARAAQAYEDNNDKHTAVILQQQAERLGYVSQPSTHFVSDITFYVGPTDVLSSTNDDTAVG